MSSNGTRIGKTVKIGSFFGPQWFLSLVKKGIKNGTITRKEGAQLMKCIGKNNGDIINTPFFSDSCC